MSPFTVPMMKNGDAITAERASKMHDAQATPVQFATALPLSALTKADAKAP
jgi:hypothetical protein